MYAIPFHNRWKISKTSEMVQIVKNWSKCCFSFIVLVYYADLCVSEVIICKLVRFINVEKFPRPKQTCDITYKRSDKFDLFCRCNSSVWHRHIGEWSYLCKLDRFFIVENFPRPLQKYDITYKWTDNFFRCNSSRHIGEWSYFL